MEIALLLGAITAAIIVVFKFQSMAKELGSSRTISGAMVIENNRLKYSNERKTKYVQVLERHIVEHMGVDQLIAAFAELHLEQSGEINDVPHVEGTTGRP